MIPLRLIIKSVPVLSRGFKTSAKYGGDDVDFTAVVWNLTCCITEVDLPYGSSTSTKINNNEGRNNGSIYVVVDPLPSFYRTRTYHW
ncbi:uncharacterized protein [Cherax quadricarinatus]|uniref:uncharacterized protein isoform X2 n=1 Tax=Cherax quadricarinatus TaxID=27406 RepID=UPI00387ED63A